MSAPGWTGSLVPRWFTDPAFRGLSAPAWGLHCWAVLWSVMQESDGEIPAKALPFVASPMLSRGEADAAAAELVAAELWTLSSSGAHQIVDWSGSQVTAEEVAARRERWRREKREQRSGPDSPPESGPVSGTDEAEVRSGNGQGPARKTGMSNTHIQKQATKETQEVDPWSLEGLSFASIRSATVDGLRDMWRRAEKLGVLDSVIAQTEQTWREAMTARSGQIESAK